MCPLSVSVSWPVAASHTFTVLVQLPLTRRLPSGLNATLQTPAGVPLEGEDFLAGRRVPHLQRLVPAAGDDPFAVGAERHAVDLACCALERERLLAASPRPTPSPCLSMTAADDPLAVGAEGHAVTPAGVPLEREHFLAGGRVPHLHRLVLAAARRCVCRRG